MVYITNKLTITSDTKNNNNNKNNNNTSWFINKTCVKTLTLYLAVAISPRRRHL